MKLIRHSDEHFFFYFTINLLKLWQYFIQQLLTIRVAPETIFLKYSALNLVYISLRRQPTFHDTTTSFPAKWLLRNDCRHSILMTRHYSDPDKSSDWLKIWFIQSEAQHGSSGGIYQYGIFALVPQTSFRGETNDSVAKFRLFSQATFTLEEIFPDS